MMEASIVGAHIMWPSSADTAAAGIEPGCGVPEYRGVLMRLERLRGPVLGPQPQHDNKQLRCDYAYRSEAPCRQLLPVQSPDSRESRFRR